jgi:hypothetical protein
MQKMREDKMIMTTKTLIISSVIMGLFFLVSITGIWAIILKYKIAKNNNEKIIRSAKFILNPPPKRERKGDIYEATLILCAILCALCFIWSADQQKQIDILRQENKELSNNITKYEQFMYHGEDGPVMTKEQRIKIK